MPSLAVEEPSRHPLSCRRCTNYRRRSIHCHCRRITVAPSIAIAVAPTIATVAIAVAIMPFIAAAHSIAVAVTPIIAAFAVAITVVPSIAVAVVAVALLLCCQLPLPSRCHHAFITVAVSAIAISCHPPT